jgi:expansin (peptidoglycan-binding protein)
VAGSRIQVREHRMPVLQLTCQQKAAVEKYFAAAYC